MPMKSWSVPVVNQNACVREQAQPRPYTPFMPAFSRENIDDFATRAPDDWKPYFYRDYSIIKQIEIIVNNFWMNGLIKIRPVSVIFLQKLGIQFFKIAILGFEIILRARCSGAADLRIFILS